MLTHHRVAMRPLHQTPPVSFGVYHATIGVGWGLIRNHNPQVRGSNP